MTKFLINLRSIILLSLCLLVLTECTTKVEAPQSIEEKKIHSRKALNPKVALVLGGGGARGFFHLGVIASLLSL